MKNAILKNINNTNYALDKVFFEMEKLSDTSINQIKTELLLSLTKEAYRNAALARDLLCGSNGEDYE